MSAIALGQIHVAFQARGQEIRDGTSGKSEAPQGVLGFAGLREMENWWVVRGSNLRLSA